MKYKKSHFLQQPNTEQNTQQYMDERQNSQDVRCNGQQPQYEQNHAPHKNEIQQHREQRAFHTHHQSYKQHQQVNMNVSTPSYSNVVKQNHQIAPTTTLYTHHQPHQTNMVDRHITAYKHYPTYTAQTSAQMPRADVTHQPPNISTISSTTLSDIQLQ